MDNNHDPVERPAHYTVGGIETIDYLRAKMSPEEFAGYCRGNVLKYLSRAPHKNGLEDLKKARWYLDRLIEYDALDDKSNQKENDYFRCRLVPVNDARSRGDGCEICIDGFINAEGGRVICDCKLDRNKPDRQRDEGGTHARY